MADLRHYAATNLLAEGVDIKTASGRLGHDPVVVGRFCAAVQPRARLMPSLGHFV